MANSSSLAKWSTDGFGNQNEFEYFKIKYLKDVVKKLQQEPVEEDDDFPQRKIQIVATGQKRLLNPLVVNFEEDVMQALEEDAPEEEEEIPDDVRVLDEL